MFPFIYTHTCVSSYPIPIFILPMVSPVSLFYFCYDFGGSFFVGLSLRIHFSSFKSFVFVNIF